MPLISKQALKDRAQPSKEAGNSQADSPKSLAVAYGVQKAARKGMSTGGTVNPSPAPKFKSLAEQILAKRQSLPTAEDDMDALLQENLDEGFHTVAQADDSQDKGGMIDQVRKKILAKHGK